MWKSGIILCTCTIFTAFGLAFSIAVATAGEVEIVDAKARALGETYTFDVTLRHADSGWEHYADKWEVVAPSGKVLAERVLLHPHEAEQPFTRSLSGVIVPTHFDHVMIRAYDKVHGASDKLFKIELKNR